MLTRRFLLAAVPLVAAGPSAQARPAPGSFSAFVSSVWSEARHAGIGEGVLAEALGGLAPNQKVIDLDRSQPEYTMTWARYRATRLSAARIAQGRALWQRHRALLGQIQAQYGVDPGVVMGIWGLESNYGGYTGGFNVVEALATLAWEGRRASFFRKELIAALKILNNGDISFPRMLGSYAGAMGQPQFMPTAFYRYAVDFDGTGQRDIWNNTADVLASIANYLAKSGWRGGEPWGEQVQAPAGLDAYAGRENRRPIAEWARLGVRRADGGALAERGIPAALILPDGEGGDAFLAYSNFTVIRRYNPSDFYALSVGMLGDLVTA
jgi:membrane-bound lytic murein transglycosylase B